MPLDPETIQAHLNQKIFFTGNRHLIEFLIGENLLDLQAYALVISSSKVILFSTHQIKNQNVSVHLYSDTFMRLEEKETQIIELLKDIPTGQAIILCFSLENMRYGSFWQSRKVELEDCSQLFAKWERVKSEEQIRRIQQCVRLNQNAYQRIKDQFRLGYQELHLANIVKTSYLQDTGKDIPVVMDLLAGEKTGNVSHFPTSYTLKIGDTVIVDLLPRYQGIYCDHTRTFFVGEPNAKQKNIYLWAQKALEETAKYLKPGITGAQIDKKMRNIFQKAGLTNQLAHHSGHSFGNTIFERPYFVKDETRCLETGMVVALEPGIYFNGEFGIRLENNYLITHQGGLLLGNIPLDWQDFVLTTEDRP